MEKDKQTAVDALKESVSGVMVVSNGKSGTCYAKIKSADEEANLITTLCEAFSRDERFLQFFTKAFSVFFDMHPELLYGRDMETREININTAEA